MVDPTVSSMVAATCSASRVTLSPAAKKITHSAEGSSPSVMRRARGATASWETPVTYHGRRDNPSPRMDFAVAVSDSDVVSEPFVTKRKRDNYLANRFLTCIRKS